jgi:hypothetical protein
MSVTWEYKAIVLTHKGGMLALTRTPDADECTAALNREGALGWELVSAVCVAPMQPTMFYLKRAR